MYDYFIVAAGAAGWVLANRLSVNPKNTGLSARGRRTRQDPADPSHVGVGAIGTHQRHELDLYPPNRC